MTTEKVTLESRCPMGHEVNAERTYVALEGCPMCGGTDKVRAELPASAVVTGPAVSMGTTDEEQTRAELALLGRAAYEAFQPCIRLARQTRGESTGGIFNGEGAWEELSDGERTTWACVASGVAEKAIAEALARQEARVAEALHQPGPPPPFDLDKAARAAFLSFQSGVRWESLPATARADWHLAAQRAAEVVLAAVVGSENEATLDELAQLAYAAFDASAFKSAPMVHFGIPWAELHEGVRAAWLRAAHRVGLRIDCERAPPVSPPLRAAGARLKEVEDDRDRLRAALDEPTRLEHDLAELQAVMIERIRALREELVRVASKLRESTGLFAHGRVEAERIDAVLAKDLAAAPSREASEEDPVEFTEQEVVNACALLDGLAMLNSRSIVFQLGADAPRAVFAVHGAEDVARVKAVLPYALDAMERKADA